MSSFQKNTSLKKRREESARILKLYGDKPGSIGRVPIVVEKIENSSIEDIDKHKFLVPSDLTVGQFMYVIRSRLKLTSEIAIFIFINNRMPPTSALISQVYKENKNDDGFLYIQYSGENTFGG